MEVPRETVPEPAAEPEQEPASVSQDQNVPQEDGEPKEPDYSAEELRAMQAEAEARANHWEQVAGRHAGKLGWLEKQVSDLRAQISARKVEMTGDEMESGPPPTPPAPVDEAWKTWAIAKAMQDGVAEFVAANPDVKDMGNDLAAYFQSKGYDPQKAFLSDDPVSAQQEARRSLEEAYWHVKAQQFEKAKLDARAKKVEQVAQAKQNKLKASVSASGSAPPPKPTAKTLQEMTLDELESALAKETGGRW